MLKMDCRVVALLAMTVLLFINATTHASAPTLPTVTVMADHSLGLVVSEIARNYSREKKAIVNNSFAPQNIQQAQISEGASADILITSKGEWIDELKLQGLIDIHSQTRLARDRLALIGPADTDVVSAGAGRFPTVAIIKAGGGQPVFVLANPETLTEGAYAKEALRSLGAAEDLEAYTLYVKRMDEMLDMVSAQNAYGICFYSSVAARTDIKIIDKLPEASHKPIIYQAVVIASDNMDEARNFLEYLKSNEVAKILSRHGLVVD
jgi:molybdate transport system substrate-binding protein